jgi:hypothetical protein
MTFKPRNSVIMQKPQNEPEIPADLDPSEQNVYKTLLHVKAQRIRNNEPPPNVLVITDLAKDFDDLAAIVELAALHHLGLIK